MWVGRQNQLTDIFNDFVTEDLLKIFWDGKLANIEIDLND